jgi:preprotein translocase subunit SecG
MSILINVLVAFHVVVCLLMVVVVLMQRPKNEGLGAAFGGGMTENIFGAQTTHVLQKFTVWLGIVFFALTLLLAILYAKRGTGETAIQKELLSQPVPAATAAPTAAPAASPTSAATEPVSVTTEPVSVTTEPVSVTTEPVAVPQAAAPMASEPAQAAGTVPAETAPSPAGN